jgi:putative Mg2+ transporter-C (MgtC) family protein
MDMLIRMASGAALGGVIGYERDRHGRPVGLRTHVLVSLSAATFMLVSSQFAYYQHFDPGAGIEVDASRIAASVVSAIGFLAGGSILRTGSTVAGLTTAAGLWLVTAIGLCAGAGMFSESMAATLFGVLALTLLRRFEDKDDRFSKKRLILAFGENPAGVAERMRAAITALGGRSSELEYARQLIGADAGATLTLEVLLPVDVSNSQLMAALESAPNVVQVRIHNLG